MLVGVRRAVAGSVCSVRCALRFLWTAFVLFLMGCMEVVSLNWLDNPNERSKIHYLGEYKAVL